MLDVVAAEELKVSAQQRPTAIELRIAQTIAGLAGFKRSSHGLTHLLAGDDAR